MIWYLEPEPLAIIARMAPGVERSETRYPLTVDQHARYAGADMDALEAIHEARFDELQATVPWPRAKIEALLDTSPQDIAGALFGDPLGRDDLPAWEAIRRNVLTAVMARTAA